MNTSTIGILATPVLNKAKQTVTLMVSPIDMSHLKDGQTQLERIYELLGCRTIDVVRTPKGDIWIDDEGLFANDNPIISYKLDTKMNPLQLAGTLLFSNGSNDDGDTVWFDKNKVSDIIKMKDIKESLKNFTLVGFAQS